MDDEIRKIMRQVTRERMHELWGHAKEKDFVLIQGDFGACYLMVNFALEKGVIPVYSTTKRDAVDEYGDDDTIAIVHQFKHRIFRRYGV